MDGEPPITRMPFLPDPANSLFVMFTRDALTTIAPFKVALSTWDQVTLPVVRFR